MHDYALHNKLEEIDTIKTQRALCAVFAVYTLVQLKYSTKLSKEEQ